MATKVTCTSFVSTVPGVTATSVRPYRSNWPQFAHPITVGLGIQLGKLPWLAGANPQCQTLVANEVEAKVVVQARYVRFQMAKVAIPPRLFRTILGRI